MEKASRITNKQKKYKIYLNKDHRKIVYIYDKPQWLDLFTTEITGEKVWLARVRKKINMYSFYGEVKKNYFYPFDKRIYKLKEVKN
jgi:hypothetical protein